MAITYPPHRVGSVGPGRYFHPLGGQSSPPLYPLPPLYARTGGAPRLTLQLVTLDPIFPSPVRDFRSLDFSALIANPEIQITVVSWTCEMAPDTPVDDWHPMDRLIDPPMIDMPNAQSTTQMVGDMIDGARYVLVAQATLSDGRILVIRGVLTCLAESLVPEPLPPGAVAFDYNLWITLFPEFRSVTPEQAHAYWVMACEIVRNDRTSLIQDPEERKDILLLLTAHIASLFGGPQGGGGFSPTMTGVITSKSVNGVSLGSSGMFPGVSGTQAWYQTSKYGQLAWMKLRAWRSFYYISGPQRDLISPWTSWPWKIGGIGGWDYGGMGAGGAIVSIPGPQGPPGRPGEPGPSGVVADQVSIVGRGNVRDPIRVAVVDSGEYDEDGSG